MMNNRRVVLSAGIGRLSDDDSSHVLDCTLPWAMRGWRDHPPDPAFRRTAPRKETTGEGLAAVAEAAVAVKKGLCVDPDGLSKRATGKAQKRDITAPTHLKGARWPRP
jgi:hypothetical protein